MVYDICSMCGEVVTEEEIGGHGRGGGGNVYCKACSKALDIAGTYMREQRRERDERNQGEEANGGKL